MSENNTAILSKLNLIKNLILLGKSDNNLSEQEIDIITQIAKHHQLTYKDIDYIVSNSDKIPFSIPSTFTERLAALYDLVVLMVSDFKIHENEKKFCMDLAKKYDFNPQIIDELIEDVLSFVIDGKECDDVMEYLTKYAHPKANLN
ncbi:hypothetical protein [Faecalibacter macacae]|uniref:TerB family tellurite resistance protein n=1 Tax=Faecalibacter macacae TaxID=1859289 RepID=A0A3L9MGR1_9FLAO|nr:hypothetical protein [Faecalibacter macacae]RLZ09759.1 hypothetical protein EAH69_08200 [Faecalibacter macacae]